MNNAALSSITIKELRTEGSGLLKDNWVRAFAVYTSRILGAAIFVMFNNLITSAVSYFMAMNGYGKAMPSFSTIQQYIDYRAENGFQIQDAVSIVLAVFYFMFISPLVLGETKWYHSLAQCDNLQVGQIFHFYRGNSNFVEALVFELNRLERHVAAILLCFAPAAGCIGLATYYLGVPEMAQLVLPLYIAGGALVLVGFIVYLFWITRYFLAKYLIVSERKLDVSDSFKTSVTYMKGLHGKVIKLILSFVPMFLSCILIAPAFVVVPVYRTTMAALALDIIDAKTPV